MPRTSNIRAGLSAAVKAAIALFTLAGCPFRPAGGADDGDAALPDDAATTDAEGAIDAAVDGRPVSALCDDDDAELRLCLSFDADVLDRSGTAAVLTTTAVGFGPGAVGAGVELGGTSVIHAGDLAAFDLTTAMTIEAFVRIDAAPPPSPRAGVLDKNGEFALWIDPQFRPYCTLVGSTATATAAIAAATWTHLACVFDGTTFALYVDGVVAATVNRTAPINNTGSDGLNLGQDCRGATASGDPLRGGLDELRLWASARSAAQIAAAAARQVP